MDRSPARWRVPVVIAALVAIAIAAVWVLRPAPVTRPDASVQAGASSAAASAGGSSAGISARPPVLRLQGRGGGGAAPMAAAGSSAKIAGPRPGYVLTGTLGTGPATGMVLTLGAPTQAQVDRLAHAFGLPPAKHGADNWVATDGTHQLSVQDSGGGNWWYGVARDCAGTDSAGGCAVGGSGSGGSVSAGTAVAPGAVAGTAVAPGAVVSGAAPAPSTAVATAPGAPDVSAPDVSGPATADNETVRRVATPVLAATGVGLDGAHVVVQDGTLTVDPLVKGLPSTGLQTSVTVDAAGTVQWANGWLGGLTDGDTYPLITAQQAFAQLEAQPRMMMMLPCRLGAPTPAAGAPDTGVQASDPVKPGTSGVVGPAVDVLPCTQGTPDPVQVTGAAFGWSMQWLGAGDAVLAPSWLFSMKGSEDWPTPIVAVDPAFLAAPDVPQEKGAMPGQPNLPVATPATAPTPAATPTR